MAKGKMDFRTVYTVFIFIFLASLDYAVVGLFPPLFSSIAKSLNVHISAMGSVSAVTILFTALSSIVWGYLADKGNRKRLIIMGTLIWSLFLFLTSLSQSYLHLIIFQIFTGLGLGCNSSIGFSVLTDYVPKKYLGTVMSLWGLSQGFGCIAGSIMAPIVSSRLGWRMPFIIISSLGAVFIFMYFFIKEPVKGAAEPELGGIALKSYNYNISLSSVKSILTKKSNFWLMIQGFFLNITLGTLLWLPTLYAAKIEAQGYSEETSLIAASYFYALFQLGGLSSTYFGYLGDRLQKKTLRARALLTGSLIFFIMPFYILVFIIPLNNLTLPDGGSAFSILLSLLGQICLNPWILSVFLLSIFASAVQSANIPNWLALITDVNLPEHRATSFSISNFINGIARSCGNAFMGIALGIVSSFFGEPDNYIVAMATFQLFVIPSVFAYYKVSENSKRDITKVKSILRKRAKNMP